MEETPETLFYAAFELRCGIEQRMREYLEVQDHVSKRLKSGWRIAKLGKNIEKIFKSGDIVVQFGIFDEHSGDAIGVLYFTPVTRKLKMMGQKIGALLHSMREMRNENDPWWDSTRRLLLESLEELTIANAGTLLGPPLINHSGVIKLSADRFDKEDMLLQNVREGTKHIIDVRYLNNVPNEVVNAFKEQLFWH